MREKWLLEHLRLQEYCTQLKAYRETRPSDMAIYHPQTPTSKEVRLTLTPTTLEIKTRTGATIHTVELDLDTGQIRVNNQEMPADYGDEFLLNIDQTIKKLNNPDTHVYDRRLSPKPRTPG